MSEEKENLKNDDGDETEIKIGKEGIHVKTIKGKKVVISSDGIHCSTRGEDDDYTVEIKRVSRYGMVNSVLFGISLLLFIVGYVLLGVLLPDGIGWLNYWPFLLLVPVIPSIYTAIYKKEFCAFVFPLLVVAAYCYIGMQFNLWHPGWVLFLLIPCYYIIFGPIDSYNRKIRRIKKYSNIKTKLNIDDIVDDDDDK